MQFSEQWLRSVVDPALDSEEFAARMTMAGFEVEDTRPVAPPSSGVVVGLVTSVERHPQADKLTVCSVDVGHDQPLSIVCGAPNVAPGIKVPCALEGAQLPGGLQIRRTKLRGVESHGMLCSARELGLSEDHAGLLVLDADAKVGADIRDHLALDDRIWTIKLTPNRGDCLSVVGLAREAAAVTGAKLNLPSSGRVSATLPDRLPVNVEARDLCGRFSGRVIRGVDAKAVTPRWMRQRLERSGQRPISALVDISNYVMLELGRPSHVFDLDKVHGGLHVRWGRPGESLELLNGQTVQLDGGVGVIADDRGVESLAGIMGGEATAVSLDTRNVYVEAAFWWPDAIRGRSRRFNFSTDAAHRFERGVDFATTAEHVDYISRLIIDICGGAAGPIDDTVLDLPARQAISMRVDRCRKVIGVPIEADAMADVFARLGMKAERTADRISVVPPSYRFDLEIEEDLIEEVARLVGYERIPAHPPLSPAKMRPRQEERRTAHDVRNVLAELGYVEVMTYSFVDAAWERDFGRVERPIGVLNPIAAQFSVMRSTLIGSLINVLQFNLNRKATRVRVFEVARVFARDSHTVDGPLTVGGVAQPPMVSGLVYGASDDEQWGAADREADFFDVKGDLQHLLPTGARFEAGAHPALHPGRSAVIFIGDRAVGFVGELHPRLQLAYGIPRPVLVFEVELEALLRRPLPVHREVPRVQAIERDIALWVGDDVPFQALSDAIDSLSRTDDRLSALREVRLFDVYRPNAVHETAANAGSNALLNKEKSLAFRIVLQDTSSSLSDTDADAAVAAIVGALTQRFGARLRQ